MDVSLCKMRSVIADTTIGILERTGYRDMCKEFSPGLDTRGMEMDEEEDRE